MNKIKILSDRIIIDGHADTRQECETATMLTNLLSAQGSGFNCVEYRNGYAEFKKSDVVKLADSELKFAPAKASVTMIFDSHISAVNSRSPMTVNWTSSGETQLTAANDGTTYTFDVVLSDGYVIDTVALSSSDEMSGKLTEKTDTTFSILAGSGGISQTITLTSKLAAVKNYIISSSRLIAIADATKAKSNITTKLTPAQIAEKINNLTIVANIDTADKMATLLVAENEGNVYKYVGTTTTDYINGDLYAVEKINSGYTVSYTNNANSAAPAEVKINGGQWTTVTEASGTFENVQTIQFYARRDQGNFAATIKSVTLGLNMSGNSVATSEVYTLTQDINDVVISWEPYREV